VADVNANIGINIDTSQSLAEIKNLQRQLAQLYTSINKGSAAAAAAQKGLATNLMNTVNAGGKFYAQMGTIRTSTESFTHALEKNKLTMREYFRFAGGSTRTFGKLFKQEFDTIGRVAEERVKKMQTQYIKLGRDASGAMKAISITPTTLNMKEYGNQVAVAAQKQALLNQLLKQGSTNLLNFGKNTQWAGRQLMVGFTIPLAYFGTAAAKTFMDLEAQALKFRRVYGDMFTTTAETEKALGEIQALAEEFTKYGVAVVKTMEMAAAAAAMGKTGADLTAQVAEATRLAVLGNVEQEQALETTISLTNAFGLAAEDLTSKINFLNAVENQTVTAIEDLTIAIPKAGPVVQQLGGSVEDLAFFLTAMREGGINASEGANALKSGLASLINPTEKAAAMLADMGINIKEIVEGNVGNLRQTVIDFALALDTLAPLERSRAIEQLFGKFQFARLSTLFQNVTKDGNQASRVLQLAGASVEELAILSERELKAVEDAIGTNFRAAVEDLKIAIAPIGKEFLKAITPVVEFLGRLLDGFNNLGDGTKKFIVILTTLIGLVGPTLLMTFGLVANGAANIIKLFILMRQGFLKLSGNSTNLAQQTQYLNSEQMEAAVVAASLNQAHSKLTQQFALEATAVNQLRNAYVQATAAATRFAAANPGMMMPGFKPGIKGGGTGPAKFSSGTTQVVGGESGKDSVPALLTPGEAVVPEPIAQDDRFKPLIAALVSGDIAKYQDGTVFAHAVDRKIVRGLDVPENMRSLGFGSANAFTAIGFDIDPDTNSRLITRNVPVEKYLAEINKPGSTLTMTARLIDLGVSPDDAARVTGQIRSNLTASLRDIPNGTLIGDQDIYSRMGNTRTGILGGIVKKSRGGLFGNAIKSLYAPTTFSPLGQSSIKMNSTASIGDVIEAVSKTRTSQNALRPLRDIQRLDPNYRLAVTRDAAGNIVAFERPEVSKTTGRMSNTKVLAALQGDRFTTARLSRGGGRSITPSKGARARATQILVGRGETVETQDGRMRVVTGQTGKPKEPGTRVSGGGPSDRRALPLTSVRRVIPRGFRNPAFGIGAEEGFPAGQSVGPRGLQERRNSQMDELTTAIKNNTRSQDDGTQTSRELKRDQRAAKAQRIGTYAGPAAMAAGTGAMVAAMAGAPQVITNMLFGISAVAGLLPMLANPLGIAIAAVAAVGVGLWKLSSDLKNASKEGANLAKSMTMTNSKLVELSKVTGTVSATESAKRRRETMLTGASGVQRKTGQTILESGFGQNLLADIQAQQKAGASEEQVAKSLGLGLSTAIMQGVLTTEQARSLAAALGEQLGSYEIPAKISGNIVSLVGPNGERLESQPLQVALEIKKQSMEQQAQVFQNAISQRKKTLGTGGEFAAAAGLVGVGALAGGPVGAAVGAGAAIKMIFDQNKLKAENLKLDTAAIQLGFEAVAQGQGLVDSLNKQYDNKIKQAKTDAEINELEKQRKSAIEAVNKENAKTLDALIKQKDQFSPGAFDAAIKAAADTMYKEGPMAVFKDQTIDALSKLENSEFKTMLQLSLASGEMDPNQILSFINMAKDNPTLQTNFDFIVNTQGMAEANVLIGLLEKSGANEKTYKIVTDFIKGNPQQFKEVQDAIASVGNILPKYGVTVDINTVGLKQLQQIQRITNTLKAEKGPITQEIVAKYAKDPNNPDQSVYQGILDTWNTLVGTSDTITKEMIIDFGATYSDPNVKNFFDASKGLAGVPEHIKGLAGGSSAQASAYLVGTGKGAQGAPKKGKGKGAGGGTKERDTTLDELLNRLKFIRKAGIDAAGGVKELMKITGGDGLKRFVGVTQQLMAGPKGGFNREFISFLESMDDKTRKTYMTIKNGEVVLTKQGKALKEAFNEKVVGEFQVANAQALQDTKAQAAALLKLQASGVDSATALQMVADANLAVAINSKDITGKELRQLAADAKAAKEEMKKLNLEVLNLAEDLKTKVGEAQDALKAVSMARQAGIVDPETLRMIAQDASLVREILQNGIGSETMKSILGSKEALKQLGDATEGVIEPAKAAMAAFEKLRDAAMKVFDQQTRAAQAAFEKSMQDLASSLAKIPAEFESMFAGLTLEQGVEKANEQIDTLRAEIASIEYTTIRPIDLNIEKAQSQIDQIKRQLETAASGLTLADGTLLPPSAYDDVRRQLEDSIAAAELNLEFNPQYGKRFVEGLQNQINDKELDLEINPVYGNRVIENLQNSISQKERELEVNPVFGSRRLESLQNDIANKERELEINPVFGSRRIESLQNEINRLDLQVELNFSRPIADLQEESSDLANELTLMDKVAQQINDKYDAQAKALQQVADVNQEILNQQRSQLDIASAITQGDIAAAARAAQEARAQAASAASQRAGGVLDAARQAELGGIRSAQGMTRADIEERQFQINQQIFALEEQSETIQRSIRDIQDNIRQIEETRAEKQLEIRAIEDEIYNIEKLRAEKQIEIRNIQDEIYQKELLRKPIIESIQKLQDQIVAAEKAQAVEVEKIRKMKDDIEKGEAAREKLLREKVEPLEKKIRDYQDDKQKAIADIAIKEAAIAKIQNEILVPLESEVKKREKILSDRLKAIEAEKTAWDQAQTALEAATTTATQYKDQMVTASSALQSALAAYNKFESKTVDLVTNVDENIKRVIDETINRVINETINQTIITTTQQGPSGDGTTQQAVMYGGFIKPMAYGGKVKPMAYGGRIGSDYVPALLTPGEFVVNRAASKAFAPLLNTINESKYPSMINKNIQTPTYTPPSSSFAMAAPVNNTSILSDNSSTVYNYSVGITVGGTNTSPDNIAKAVLDEIKYIDSQRIRGQRA
jgi:TP901 family phage tail tape measure protein